ncbi:MAG: L,D-transpeptidase family protein [Hyphomicrobium sp.]
MRITAFTIAASVCLCFPAAAGTSPPVTEPAVRAGANSDIQARVIALGKPGGRSISGARIASFDFLPKLYESMGYQRLWTNPANITALKEAVRRSWEDGLLPTDFHGKAVADFSDPAVNDANSADRDIILSDAFVRLLYQLYFGKVSPNGLDPNWNFARPALSGDPVKIISSAIAEGAAGNLVEKAKLAHPIYQSLKAMLQAYTHYSDTGGWPQLPPGPAVKPGASDVRIPILRQRLAVTGEYQDNGNASSEILDEKLTEALRKFQKSHGLEAEGNLGPQTQAELNVPVQTRIEQIRVNLERGRWILRTIGDEFVAVNVAGFYLRVVLEGKPVWGTRVIVGQTYHKTPIFTEAMKSIVFNPDWTVPRSIVRNEMFAKASADPGYLAANNYTLTSTSGAVDPATIDWTQWTAATFPYGVVQRPGPKNALGLVKFLFPNKYSVYLHDTPGRGLFGKSGRTFSHGCIRVEDPMKLAEIILGNRLGWDRSKIDSIVAAGKLYQVNLPKPLPVLLLYWTVDPQFDGSAYFYQDIYGRDARLLKALNTEFSPATR